MDEKELRDFTEDELVAISDALTNEIFRLEKTRQLVESKLKKSPLKETNKR
jgi:hypothetical protein